ncbi:MAG: hypothetical protein IT384_19695 [Deltaproteobacteria bacterium]|nr:hypothetical protein [Deltaproteobacteria bacterium]
MGPELERECRLWVERFLLEEATLEAAVAGYVQTLGSSDDAEVSDEEAARALGVLREELSSVLRDDASASDRALEIEALTARLDRALARTELIERSGEGAAISDLRRRLTAGRAMIGVVRAALARRSHAR